MGDIPKWLNMADWSDMPDVYVTKAECQQGMFWRIEACSVPMVMLPEVRLIRADSTNAKLRELRERVAGMPGFAPDLYACTGEEATCVFRDDVLGLIDAMLTETSDQAMQLPSG